MSTTKVQLKTFVKGKLATDVKWQTKALLAIYDFQTRDEQEQQTTNKYNGVGFTGSDAKILSSMATFFQKRNYLSPKQLDILARKMPKYWAQIINISDPVKLENMIGQ